MVQRDHSLFGTMLGALSLHIGGGSSRRSSEVYGPGHMPDIRLFGADSYPSSAAESTVLGVGPRSRNPFIPVDPRNGIDARFDQNGSIMTGVNDVTPSPSDDNLRIIVNRRAV
jgi:hypothetical protein